MFHNDNKFSLKLRLFWHESVLFKIVNNFFKEANYTFLRLLLQLYNGHLCRDFGKGKKVLGKDIIFLTEIMIPHDNSSKVVWWAKNGKGIIWVISNFTCGIGFKMCQYKWSQS